MKQKIDEGQIIHKLFSLRWCLLVYLCLTGVNLVIHNRLIDSQAGYIEKRQELHQQVLQNKAPAPIQYRVMAYYAAEMFQKMGFSLPSSYLVFRGISIFLAAWMMHLFLLNYFPAHYAFVGVLYLLGCMPMTYINYYMQESDAMNLFFFLVSCMLIRKRKDGHLFPVLILSMLNRETPVLIPLVWLLFRWDELPVVRTALTFAGLLVTALGTYAGLRYIFGHHESYSEFFYLFFNLTSVNSYLYFLIFFAPFLIQSFKGLGSKPKYIRRLILFTPFYLIFHLTIPIFQEARLLLPLFPIFIAGGLSYYYRTEDIDAWQGNETPAWLKKTSIILYITGFILFMALIGVYYKYVEKSHVSSWRTKDLAEQALKEGREFMLSQDFTHALTAYEKGLQSWQDNFDLHFNTALVYTHYLKNHQKALFHWNKCLQINPDHERINDVLAELDLVKKME